MSKHTEGPWEIYTWADHMPHAGMPASIGESDDLGMEADDVCNMVQLEDDQETWANARLIAAAPELLEALEDIVDSGEIPYCRSSPLVIAARAAIKKARGA